MKRDFTLFWLGQIASSSGSVFTAVALPLVAVEYLHASVAAIGVLAAAGSVGLLLFGLPTGLWADRLPRKRPALIGADLLAAVALAAVIVAFATGHRAMWQLVGLAFVLGVVSLFVEAAYFAHLRSLVGRDDMMRARAWLQGGERAGGVAGRMLVGPAALAGAILPFVVDLFSYLASALCLALIKRPEEPGERAEVRFNRAELVGGFRAFMSEPFIRRMTFCLTLSTVSAGAVTALLAPFVLTVLHVPPVWYGALFVLIGFAGIAGSAVGGRLAGRTDGRVLAVAGVVGGALASVVLPLAGGPRWAAAVVAAIGIALPAFFGAISNIGYSGYVTSTIPEELLGRTVMAMQLTLAIGTTLGAVGAGAAATGIGVRPALWLSTLLALAAAPLVWRSKSAETPADNEEALVNT